MRFAFILLLALAGLSLHAGGARANCFPVKADVVSLGEKAARFYADRSLTQGIEDRKGSIQSSGSQLGRVARAELSCQPFPNLIGADEWHCIGEAKVCDGATPGTSAHEAKAVAAGMSRHANPVKQKASAKPGTPAANPKY